MPTMSPLPPQKTNHYENLQKVERHALDSSDDSNTILLLKAGSLEHEKILKLVEC